MIHWFTRFRKPKLHPAAIARREESKRSSEAYRKREAAQRARCVANLPMLRISIARERAGR